MYAMTLNQTTNLLENSSPLKFVDIPIPTPNNDEILIKVTACGLCHTDIDEIEGRTPPSRFPMILGHQIVGTVATGRPNGVLKPGDRVGVAWIHSACGRCRFCLQNQENLCPHFQATGRDAPGGYAQYTTVKEEFTHLIPSTISDVHAAPLLCAGAVGYRSLKLATIENKKILGLYGFGASAHLVIQTAQHIYPEVKFYVFARKKSEQKFAIDLGADWAGDIEETPPTKMDAAIDTTPVWRPIVMALAHLIPGGRVVINAIRKENIDRQWLQKLDYTDHFWQEKEIKSVANVTREDVRQFLEIAAQIPIIPKVKEFSLKEANHGLVEIKTGKIKGAKVLVIK